MLDRQHNLDYADILIVGNGIAGLTAAIESRRLAPSAQIAIISGQCHPTINTPALKQFAIGKLAREQLLAYPAGTERSQRIHIIKAWVEGINAQSKYVCLSSGHGIGYGSLLIATGSVPNSLPANLSGRDFDGVLSLHSLQDYLNLLRRLDGVDSAVVIGGGAHAIETVMSLLHYGIEVHWLIRGQTFLSQSLDDQASQMVLDTTRRAGANIHTSTSVAGIVGRVGSVIGVVTTKGQMIPCQLVLACTGTSPETTLAERCNIPLLHQRGILVDDQLRTSVPSIYAAGDVAARKNPLTGIYETRAQWNVAVQHGRIAAAMMTDHPELASRRQGVPWHATHLGDLCMLTVGDPLSKFGRSTTEIESHKKKYCRMSILDNRLVGYLSLGSTQPDSLAIKYLIDEGIAIGSVKKALLKGNVDVHKYSSQLKSRATQEMVTSGKIPVVSPKYYPMPVSPSIPVHSTIYEQATIHEWREEQRPNTDKLVVPANFWGMTHRRPALLCNRLMLPSRPLTHTLWSYSEETPAINVRPTPMQLEEPAHAGKINHDASLQNVNFLL